MTVRVITPPAPIVTLAEAKAHLRVEHADDDGLLTTYVAAATGWLDGPAGWLGRSLGIQELEYSGWFGCSKITLPYPPSVLVVAITAEAEDGSDTVVDPSSYDLCGQTVIVSPGAEWVRLAKHRITYRAGYGRLEGDPAGWVNDGVPEPVRVAIMMLVA